MTMLNFTRVEDNTEELGLDLQAPEITAKLIEQRQMQRRKVDAGVRRREALKTNAIVALVASVFVAVCMQSTVNDQVSKAVRAASVTQSTPAAVSTAATVVAPGKQPR